MPARTIAPRRRAAAKNDAAATAAALTAVFDMPGHLLRRCQQIAVSIFLAECKDLDLTPLQFIVLAALARHGALDQATLGGRAALDRTTVAVVVRNLAARRLVSKRRSAEDRRASEIALTAAGRKLCAVALPRVETAQWRMLEPLNEAERGQFVDFMRRIAAENNAYSRAPERA